MNSNAKRTHIYHTCFSLLAIFSVLLGAIATPLAALAAPFNDAAPQLQTAVASALELAEDRPIEAASVASVERPVEKAVEAPIQAPEAMPSFSPGQPTPVVVGSSSITVTKSVVGSSQSNFSVNIVGPSYPSGAVVPISSGTQVITGLVSGVYTITEVSPGAGWTTTYTTTTGTASNNNVVVTLQNVSPMTPFLPRTNLAIGKSATQSSDFTAATTAGLAIDGNTNGNFGSGSVMHTNSQANAWWEIDLGAVYPLAQIVVWNRTDCCSNRLDNSRVFVSDVPFTSQNYTTTLAQSGVSNYRIGTAIAGSNPFTVNRTGRYVRVQLEGTNFLALAEVQVFAQIINGIVFEDFNSDGQISKGTITDTGVSGVNVTVYDRTDNVVANATTDASGSYIIPISVEGPYRVEFTNLPSGYEPSRVYTGTQNGTTVQFVDTATVAERAVNLGVLAACDYCQNNPTLVVPIYRNGDPLGGGTSATQINSYGIAYNASGASPTTSNVSTHAATGAIWGQAYQRETKKLLRSAVVRRHDGLGSGGLGAIYVTTMNGTPSTSLLVDLETLGVDFGTIASNSSRGLLAASDSVSVDAQAFPLVGKVGIGGIDLSSDGTTLYVVNLFDRKLYQAAIGNPLHAPTFLSEVGSMPWLTNGNCTNGVARPWAVKQYRDVTYVGVVCTAESEAATLPTTTADFGSPNLDAYVYAYAGGSWTQVLSVPLDYAKGETSSARHGTNIDNDWLSWTDVYTRDTDTTAGVAVGASFYNDTGRISRPQPILSDLAFDTGGNMILGFMDRGGMQMGWSNRTPDYVSGTELIQYNISGDILRACGTASSGWTLEQDGVCGGVTGGGENGQGPDGSDANTTGGEFYAGDFYTNGTLVHNETMNGALATLPGTNDVASAAMDPFAIDSGGVYWLSNLNGSKVRAAQLYAESGAFTGANSVTNGTFGKAGAMGDIAILCDPAPIEIGNRVWWDIDSDGVQDAGEPGIAGVQVSLQTVSGTVNTTTDVNGSYYFTRETTVAGATYSTTLRPNTLYTVTISAIPSNYSLTTPNAHALSGASVSSNHAISDVIDSDAALVSNIPTIYYTTGDYGQNNHGLDFGFTKPATGQVNILNTALPASLGNRVWSDLNANGLQDSGEPGIAGATVGLLDGSGNTVMCVKPGVYDTYRDEFSTVSNTQSDGTLDWTGDSWVLTSGAVIITSGGNPGGSLRVLSTATTVHATRPVDLSVFTTNPTLSFDYNMGGLAAKFNIQYSSDGGASFTTLATLSDNNNGFKTITYTLPTLAANAQIRIAGFGGSGGNAYFDNLTIRGQVRYPVTDVTDANGLYTFTSDQCVQASTTYQVRIDMTQNALIGVAAVTTQNAGGVTSNDPTGDDSDSDAVSVTINNKRYAQVTATSPAAGPNYSYDFGFVPDMGTIIIRKATTPAGSNQMFSFTSNVLDHTSFTVSDGGSYTMTNVPIGTYTVTETASSGWTQTTSSCTNSSTIGAIQVTKAVTTTCSVLNVQQPTTGNVLTVTKTVNWNGNTPTGQPFNITISGPSFPGGKADTLTAGATKVYTNIMAGVYTVTETSPGIGWVTTYSVPSGVVNLSGASIAPTTAGPISGKVYQDFNSNGQIDSSGTVTDVGMSGVTVVAYDPNGVQVGAATSNSSGNYSLTPTKPGPYRVELQGAPAGYYPTTHGTQNGTSTQFVTTNGGATNVNFGLNAPENYCQNNPLLCTSEMIAGDPANATTGAISALKKWSYSATNGSVTPTNLANDKLVGTVWGLAYARSTDKLYSAAFLKRHAGLGPNGLGAIYVTNNPRTGTGVTTALFFDVATIAGVNVGSVPSNVTRGLNTPTGTSLDKAIYDQVGKVGLGDIDISDDESMLWTISLNDKKLIGVSVSNPSAATAKVYTIPDPGCRTGSGDYRPFATKYYRGQLYVGVTCDASISLLQNDLKAMVYRFNPSNPGLGFTVVLNVPLNYVKGATNSLCTSNPAARWFPWVNTPYPTGFNPTCPLNGNKLLPQPLLSDLEFDVDGSLILGFMDRFANQAGSGLALPDNTNTGETMAGGDILRAYNNNGSFVLENNGTAGSVSGGVGTNQGPGGGEFYQGEFIANRASQVQETANGGLAFLSGSGEVVSTVWDPFSADVHHGVAFLSNTDGNANRRHSIGLNDLFSKGAGLGDLELLCDSAPLEIGNRVWKDLNGNGVQDPGEPGLVNVTVSLQSPTHTITTNTDANGLYYFSVSPNTAYMLMINPSQAALNGLTLTQANMQAVSGNPSSNDALLDTRDSDAVTVNGTATISYTTGLAGQNNHGLDFGFTKPVTGQVDIFNVAPVLTSLQIVKLVSGGSSSDAFTVTVNGPSGYSVITTVTTSAARVLNNLIPGVYTVTETSLPSAPAGLTWSGTVYTPTNGAVTLVGGGSTVLTINNQLAPIPPEPAALVINKLVTGGVSGGPFTMTVLGPNSFNQTVSVVPGTPITLNNLTAGIYVVSESSLPAAPYGFTWDATTYNPADGTINLGADMTGTVTVTNPLTPTVQRFGDRLWLESDNDGDAATDFIAPVANYVVTATAQNGTIYTSLTDDNGYYTFTVPAGTYTVTYGLPPAGYQPSSTPGGSVVNASSGGNDTSHESSTVVTLNPSEIITTVDFGFSPILPVQFGDRVWIESDPDGLVSTGTITPVEGMTITATNGISTFVTTTDAEGYYSFTVPAGTYTVTYGSVPASYGAVVPSTVSGTSVSGNSGSYRQADNPDVNHGQNTVVTLAGGEANWEVDFGFYPPASLQIVKLVTGGSSSDAFTVMISGPSGYNVITTVTTSAARIINNLTPGLYTVSESSVPDAPAGFVWDSVAYSPAGGTITLNPGASDIVTVTNQLTPTVQRFGDRLWLESDNDGDAATNFIGPVANKVITATDQNGTVYTSLTDDNGYYTFTVPAGTYTVTYGLPPVGYQPSSTPGGSVVNASSGGNDTSHESSTVVALNPNEIITTVDFGFSPILPVQFGDRVWVERDGDGLVSTGTITPVEGMTITATNGISTFVTTTDAQGYYSFTVAAGTYTVTYGSVPASYGTVVPSTVVSGTSVSGNSGSYRQADDPDANHGQNTVVTLAGGEANWEVDFGFYPPASLQIVKLVTGGSSSDAFTVTVSGPSGYSVITTVTSSAARVLDNLIPGVYTVTETSLPAAPAGYEWAQPVFYSPAGGVVNVVAATLAQVNITNILAQSVSPTATLVLTKSVIGSNRSNYAILLTGPSYPSGQSFNIISGTNTITNLIPGVYTVTETSPGAGWTTTYTATTGYSTGSSAVVTMTNAITATAFAATQITGTVYNDYNSDGLMTANGTLTETGVASVTVTAYDVNNNAVGSATTSMGGVYTLTLSAAGPYRVEFSNLPVGYYPTAHGTGNGTSTQFVTTNGGTTNVNFGVNVPSDYCQANPSLCTPLHVNGLADTSSPTEALLKFAYTSSGAVGGGNTTLLGTGVTSIASKVQVGALWGVAYRRSTKTVYTAAFVRRHVGLGPNGAGAIYATDINGTSTALFADLASLGINVGAVPSNSARGLGAPSTPNHDDAIYSVVGKVGLGDIDIADDESTLYVTSLNDKTLYALEVPSGVLVGSYAIPDPGCVGGDWRPFGTKAAHDGSVYVGGVCDAQTSQSRNDLKAYVYRLQPSAGAWTQVLTIPLNYTRYINFQPWIDGGQIINNPQPVLSDIEFDVDGSLILGFMDRRGYQFARGNYLPSSNTIITSDAIPYGEILRAHNNNGVFVLESNGTSGPVTTAGANNASGPGGGEFYYDDGSVGGGGDDLSMGALALKPGTREVATMMVDPAGGGSNGVAWMNNRTGVRNRAFTVYWGLLPYMYKGAGTGDLEVLCDAAPIEIGNRVWNDINNNGVQDPNEPGLAGVVVSLQTISGTITTTTNISGTYYFTREATTGAYNTTLRANTLYTITINPNQSALSGYSLTLANQQAISGSTSSNDAILDTRDSDAYLVNGTPSIYYTTGSAGQNNHGLDFGFAPNPKVGVTITNQLSVVIGNYVWIDNNRDGLQDGSDTPIPGVKVELLDGSGNPVMCVEPGVYDTYRDEFVSSGDDNSDGSLDWSQSWVRTFTSMHTTEGNPDGSMQINGSNANYYSTRAVDLSVFVSAPTLSVDYDMNGVASLFSIQYSVDGGTNFTTLATLSDNNNGYKTITYTLPSTATVATAQIRIRGAGAGGWNSYFDNVTIRGQVKVAQSDVTDANGKYTFSDVDCVQPSTTYQIRIANNQSVLNGLYLTTQNAGNVTTNDPTGDDSDSDAATATISGTQYSLIAVAPSPAGGSNYSYDFGYLPRRPTLQITKEIIGSNIVATFPITLYGPNGSVTPTSVTPGTVTELENLPAGVYTVTEGTLPAAPDGYEWALPAYSPNNGVVTLQTGQVTQVKLTNILAQRTSPTATLVLTKSVVGSSQTDYQIVLTGPSYPSGQSINVISGTNTITNLIPGVYTVTETSPGTGWVMTYTVGSVNSTNNAVITMTNAITAVLVTPGRITGTVYADFGEDGNYSAGDVGVQGVTVTAYDQNGAAVGSTSTNISGTFSLTPTASGPWRLEYTNLPTSYEPSRIYTGTQNGTATQFVNSLPIIGGLYFAINNPADYSQSSPSMATPLHINGGTNTSDPVNVMVKFSYDWDFGSPLWSPMATKSQIGTTWGLAYARSSKVLYAASFLKRHTGLGPNGLGAIYAINTTGGTPTLFADLATLGVNVGSVLSNNARGLSDPSLTSNDPTVFDQIGKVGLGDIDLSDDERTLYVVSLNNNTLYALNVPAGTMAGSYAIPDPGCTGGAWRPFALKYKQAELYVGGVCDAQSSQNRANMQAVIYRFTPGANTFTQVLNFALNYNKGPATGPGGSVVFSGWYPWLSTFDLSLIDTSVQAGTIAVYPQPMLSDIEFDVDGSMILGFMDRFGHQGGDQNYGTSGTTTYDALIGGDILRAALTNGSYVLENNGKAGAVTTAGANNNQGPGGGEFYYGDSFVGGSSETSMGGLALKPGSGEVVLTVMDPWHYISGGVSWFNNTNGYTNRRYEIYIQPGSAERREYFGKANGLGDLELLLDPAPIEIGNRVWNDVNGNGVQDPGEPAFAGVVVSLQTLSGTITTTTNINGSYLFTREAASGAYSTTLRQNTAYTITINPNQSALSGYLLTRADQQAISGLTTSNHAILDTRDSDAYLVGGLATIYYTTGLAGQNNHGLDFGFGKSSSGAAAIVNTAPLPASLQIVKLVTGGSSSDAFTVTVNGPSGYSVITTVTSSAARVLDNLTSGVYTVTETSLPAAPAGFTWSGTVYTPTNGEVTLVGGGSAVVTINNQLAPIPPEPAALVINKLVTGGVSSGPFTMTVLGPNSFNQTVSVVPGTPITLNNLTAGIYVVSESSLPAAPYGFTWDTTTYNPAGGTINLSAGMTGTVTVTNPLTPTVQRFGDRLWLESDNDGDAATNFIAPVANYVITATNQSGTVYTTATDNNGYYTFTVPAGTYTVTYGLPPAGYQPSSTPGGSVVNASSGGNDTSHASSTLVALNPSEIITTVDFGFNPLPAQFGDRVWIESDTDGLVSTGTITPVLGMTITATNGISTYVTTTDAQGYYSFTLAAGTYTVTYGSVPASYGTVVPSPVVSGTSVSGNSGSYRQTGNPDANHGQNTVVTLAAGEANWQVDFGFYPLASLQIVKLVTGGSSSSTFTVTISGPSGYNVITTVTTSAARIINNLTPGLYTVSESPVPAAPAGFVWESVAYSPAGGTITLNPGASGMVTVTNPLTPTVQRFGDRLWLESDNDGDAATNFIAPVANYVITATNQSGTVYTTVTDNNGYYTFTVPAGTYTVTYGLPPAGYQPSSTPGGSVVNASSGGNDTSHASSTLVTLNPSEIITTVDFGFNPLPAQFGDRVWVERDGDGLVSTGIITPVQGMIITATNGISTFVTTTDGQGYYSFTVPAGVYTVTYGSVPASYGDVIPSVVVSGTSASGNSGSYRQAGSPDANHGQNTVVTLAGGEANWQVDFAFTPLLPANLHISKVATPSVVHTGDLVTYTITLTNDGLGAAANVTVRDLLPADVTYVTHSVTSGSYGVATGNWTVPTMPVGTQVLTITVRVE